MVSRFTELNHYWTYTHLNPGKSELPCLGYTGFIQPSKAGMDWSFYYGSRLCKISPLPTPPVQKFGVPYLYISLQSATQPSLDLTRLYHNDNRTQPGPALPLRQPHDTTLGPTLPLRQHDDTIPGPTLPLQCQSSPNTVPQNRCPRRYNELYLNDISLR